ncbi:MAG: short-chain fatty acyl-CoA regulator family protein [Paracoccaceae bacterium]
MPKSGLTGSRIRERRMQLGLRQSVLARTVGISAAYLNLIEHNRRRIAGKLLIDIGRELGVDPNLLAEGAESALIEALRDAGAGQSAGPDDLARPEDFAGRFPGWAGLVAAQHRRIVALEHTAEALTDRLTHDPQLAASMHEVLSVVTAIRSTAAILADTGDIDPDWQKRFHRNLYEDSQRLAESSQALLEYLDQASDDETEAGLTLPQEELESWLERRGYHVDEMECDSPAGVDEVLSGAGGLPGSPAALSMARSYLRQYREDARAMPHQAFHDGVAELGHDPAALATRFGVGLASVFRRMASLPQAEDAPRIGLVQCDSSGTLTFRKPVEGFALPRFGAACPLWPLYQALVRPMTPVRMRVEQAGRNAAAYLAYAISQPAAPAGFDMPQVFHATMLILPEELAGRDVGGPALPIGSSCRICPRDGCAARREPSILTDGF